MLKTRVIPTVLQKDTHCVKGQAFDSWRGVGTAMQAVRVYNMRDVDELILLDIAATPAMRGPDIATVRELCGECFMPVTVGGGVTQPEHFRDLLLAGADKIAINTAAVETPLLIEKASRAFGAQAVVVSIDVKGGEVVTHCGRVPTGLDPAEFAADCERLGAGEILITAIDRDGTMQGYDVDLIRRVSRAVSIPVVASGGCGNAQHMAEALRAGAHAVAAASIFHFTEQTPKGLKRDLAQNGIAVRLT